MQKLEDEFEVTSVVADKNQKLESMSGKVNDMLQEYES